MYNIAKSAEREELFINTASKMKIDVALVEKDFWICLTLDYLFSKSKWKNSLIFKGGTSLSKVYNIIERFSEDIDLILDWRILGYKTNEPWESRSKTKQLKFIEESRNRLFNFLQNDFMPTFKKDMEQLLNTQVDIYISNDDLGTICFAYPRFFEDKSILRIIRLEIGALAAWSPAKKMKIHSYAADYYPNVFNKSETEVLTTTIERTFWEKATILHQEANRPKGSTIPARYSRHYYDIYCIFKSHFYKNALKDKKLLREVAEFKNKFYPRLWARYDLAKEGKIKLYPASHSIETLQQDYEKMRAMIYGDYPKFKDILACLRILEESIKKQFKQINK